MLVTLSNNFMEVQIDTLGAELQSIRTKDNNWEYVWQGDPSVWGRHAPVLFPIVGRLLNDEYQYEGKTYHMGQHGFARDREFEVESRTETEVVFKQTDDEKTREIYPFAFILKIKFTLDNDQLKVDYDVENPDDQKPLYFSIGAHPGFSVPINPSLKFDDYFLSFKPRKSRVQIPFRNHLIDFDQRTLVGTDTDIALTHELFKDDAIIFEGMEHDEYIIATDKDPHAVRLTVNDAQFVGVWTAYPTTGPFVCIEPWWGIADDSSSTGDLKTKRGINLLKPHESFKRGFKISVK